jgi:4a-hydroxytetrahydrobiopterin dehydratase
MELAEKRCIPCRGGVPPLTAQEQVPLLAQLEPGWTSSENRRLHKAYKFRDFAEALAFTDRVGAIAEEQQHHPDIYLAWGKVRIEIWTHKIDGLTESDFVFAAKCDRVTSG